MRTFEKYEGLGNDFVVVDTCEWTHSEMPPALVRALCDRRRGVGADGVLRLRLLTSGEIPSVGMEVFNADGSRATMCGNGVRCVATWLVDRGLLRMGGTVIVQSDAGPRAATVLRNESGASIVTVEMGAIVVTETATIEIDGAMLSVDLVDAGNPHGVVFRAEGADEAVVRAVGERSGAAVGINVEIVTLEGDVLNVRVHERGVGWTRACGTGACAVAASAIARGLAPRDTALRVVLAGGELTVVIDAEGRARLTGPARRVFAGSLSGDWDSW